MLQLGHTYFSSAPVEFDSIAQLFECSLMQPINKILYLSLSLQAFDRPNVDLVTDKIDKFTSKGIKAGSKEREHDIIIYATGFNVEKSFKGFQVRYA